MPAGIQSKTESRSGAPTEQANAVAVILQEAFAIEFCFFDARTGAPLDGEKAGTWVNGSTESGHLAPGRRPLPPPLPPGHPCVSLDPAAVLALAADGRARVMPLPQGGYQLVLPISRAGQPALVAAGVIGALAPNGPASAWEQAMLQGWLQGVGDRLRLAEQLRERRHPDEERSSQTMAPWETLLSLDQVIRGLRLQQQPATSLQRILEAAFKALGAQTLIWIPQHPDQPVLCQGQACLAPADCRQLALVLAHQPNFRPPGPLLCDHVPGQKWGARFPSVVNLLAFQGTDQQPLGWVVALNKSAIGDRLPADSRQPAADSRQPFRRTDAALLMPFVALLEMHLRSTSRYQDLKDLLVGLTRSLTTALDAKDPCTSGHSERVARIAVELGREMGLEGDELGDIYLAGLLHDIGKIGIRDTVLLKPGALTPEEQQHIQEHVKIGHAILADLRQIRNLLPGVLYHHERYDGAGYPDRLVGDNIPLLARILAVADSYDAMSNVRPYRQPLPCDKIEHILTQGMNTQWDQRVVEAFLRCRQKIHTIRRQGVGDSLRLAVEGALRSEAPPPRAQRP